MEMMLPCIIICCIFFLSITSCDSKTSKWWESFVPFSEEATETTNTIRSDSALFKQLNEAMQPVSKQEKFIHMGKSMKNAIEKFQLLGNSDSTHVHQGIVFIKQKNLKALEDILYAVSDPRSAHYGKHLSHEEVTTITADLKSLRHVTTYLKRKGFRIVDKSLGHEFLTIEGPVSLWESTLNTQFFQFQSPSADGKTIITVHRAHEFSLPEALHPHVTTIFRTIDFPDVDYVPTHITESLDVPPTTPTTSTPTPLNRRIRHGYVTPQLLNTLYDVRNNTGNSLASQGVFETLGQTFSPTDLTTFQEYFGLPIDPIAVDINGHMSDQTCRKDAEQCIEANLDVQYLMAMAQAVPTTYYYWAGKEFVLDWIVDISHMVTPPLVMSISYGADEAGLPAEYADTFNLMAMKLGVRGVTITASSGDDGAVSSAARKNPMRCGYAPSFPATSPYVTAVGGTQGPENGTPEVACQGDKHGSITTGGGFSTTYSTPPWQTSFVQTYFDHVLDSDTPGHTHPPPYPGYARHGRGYPDISLLAHNYLITLSGNLTGVSGTSASAPVFAGMLSLLNAQRLAYGRPTLGWINPALYVYGPDTFVRDITEGSNECVAVGIVCCSQGFRAAPGWDPVTGLGSVNFTAMEAVFRNLGMTPTGIPTGIPTGMPTGMPNGLPGGLPVSVPTPVPTPESTPVPPTRAPSQSAGWMYVRQYAYQQCNGTVTAVSGIPSNQCMVEYDEDNDNDNTVSGSRLFLCQEDGIQLSFYSDGACSDGFLLQQQQYFYGCAVSVSDTYYAATPPYSVDVVCTPGKTALPPLPHYDGRYIVHSSYDDTTGCPASSQSSVDIFLQNHCFDVPDKDMSYAFHYPTVRMYQGSGCKKTAHSQSEQLNTVCTSTASDSGGGGGGYGYGSRLQGATTGREDSRLRGATRRTGGFTTTAGEERLRGATTAEDGDDTAYAYGEDDTGNTGTVALFDKWWLASVAPPPVLVLPTIQPTTAPAVSTVSIVPTVIPTRIVGSGSVSPTTTTTTTTTMPVNTYFQVTYSQVLEGITVQQWTKNAVPCFASFRFSIRKLLPAIGDEDILPLQVLPVSSTGTITTTNTGISSTSGTSSDTGIFTNITYQITGTSSQHHMSEATLAVREITDVLSQAISGGTFDIYLHYYALSEEMSELLTVSTRQFQTLQVMVLEADPAGETSPTTGLPDSSSSSSSDMSALTMAFTVIAVMVVLVVGGISLSRCCSSTSSGSKYVEVSLESDSMHASSVSNPMTEGEEEEVTIEMRTFPASSTATAATTASTV